MLNNEITLEEYADIVIDYALSTPTLSLPFPFEGEVIMDITNEKKIGLRISGIDFFVTKCYFRRFLKD